MYFVMQISAGTAIIMIMSTNRITLQQQLVVALEAVCSTIKDSDYTGYTVDTAPCTHTYIYQVNWYIGCINTSRGTSLNLTHHEGCILVSVESVKKITLKFSVSSKSLCSQV